MHIMLMNTQKHHYSPSYDTRTLMQILHQTLHQGGENQHHLPENIIVIHNAHNKYDRYKQF